MYTKIIFCFRYADQVSIGDEILTPGNANLSPATVVNLSSSKMQGDFVYYLLNFILFNLSLFQF